jgi:hypothetical protein
MWLPIVVPFWYALQSKAAAGYFPIQLGEKKIRQFHLSSSTRSQEQNRMPNDHNSDLGQNRSSIRGTMQSHAEHLGAAPSTAFSLSGSAVLVGR